MIEIGWTPERMQSGYRLTHHYSYVPSILYDILDIQWSEVIKKRRLGGMKIEPDTTGWGKTEQIDN